MCSDRHAGGIRSAAPCGAKAGGVQHAAIAAVATGAHLCPRLGETVREIEADGVPIAARLPIFVGDENEPVAVTIARTHYRV